MKTLLRDIAYAAQCQVLRQQIMRFAYVVDVVIHDMVTISEEWKLERLHTYDVTRIHRIRFDERMRTIEFLIDEFRDDSNPTSLRSQCIEEIDKCYDLVVGLILRMDSGISPLSDWESRLQSAQLIVSDRAAALILISTKLRQLLSAKEASAKQIQQDFDRISKDF